MMITTKRDQIIQLAFTAIGPMLTTNDTHLEGVHQKIDLGWVSLLVPFGFIEQRMDENNRSKIIYSLTQKGKDMLPIMLEVTQWSSKYDALTNTPTEFQKALKKDNAGLTATLKKGLDAGA
jgi:hypothetical protein